MAAGERPVIKLELEDREAEMVSDFLYSAIYHGLGNGWWDDQDDMDRLAYLTDLGIRMGKESAKTGWKLETFRKQWGELNSMAHEIVGRYPGLKWNAKESWYE